VRSRERIYLPDSPAENLPSIRRDHERSFEAIHGGQSRGGGEEVGLELGLLATHACIGQAGRQSFRALSLAFLHGVHVFFADAYFGCSAAPLFRSSLMLLQLSMVLDRLGARRTSQTYGEMREMA
jgi:hypothetical protein